MDAIELLSQQHLEIEKSFTRVEAARRADQPSRFAELARLLRRHSFVEQAIFYAEVRRKETADLVMDALDAHDHTEELLEDIERTGVAHQTFFVRLTALREHVREHVRVEQEELFPRVKELLSEDELKTMGRDIEESGEEWDEEDQGETEPVEPKPQTSAPSPLD